MKYSDKILLVENNRESSSLLKKLLTINDYNTILAESSSEVYEVFKEEIPQMIISNWTLPAINAPELCRSVKSTEEWKSIYFIILSSKVTLNDRISGLDFGADDFIVKPVENQELLARIRTGIRVNNLRKELKKREHEKALLEIACTIGHQLNNPLSSLIFALVNVRNGLGNEKLNEDFALIEKSITRIRNLAADLIQLKEPKIVDYIPGTGMLKL